MNATLETRSALHLLLLLALGQAIAGDADPAVVSSSTNLTELRERIMAHLAQPRFEAATWGLKVVSLDTGETLFEHNAHKLFKPASNAKLFTAALALDRLGPDYRIKTSLYAAAKPRRRGTLEGPLIVYGRGDPGFAGRSHDGDPEQALQPLVDPLIAAGIRRVSGDLVGDERFFRGPPFGSGWEWEDLQHPYGAEVSALTHEDNSVEVTVHPAMRLGARCRITTQPATRYLTFLNRTTAEVADGACQLELYRPLGANVVTVAGRLPLGGSPAVETVTVHDPALWFVTQLKEKLARSGITVAGEPCTRSWLDSGGERLPETEIASVESAPLGELVAEMVRTSRNLQAQLLLLHVGAVAQNRSGATEVKTTQQAGLEELGHLLDGIGVPKSEVLLDEGSGLSQNALVTPNAVAELLRAMDRHRHAESWHRSLPVAGGDGTLSDRMKGTAAEKNVTAKTGSLRRTRTLSGYVRTGAGERLVFSLMLNNHETESSETADRDIDAVAVMLAEFRGRRGRE